MTNNKHCIPSANINRLHVQGYGKFNDKELTDFRFGIRFAYGLCATGVAIGLVLANMPILIVMGIIAFLGVILPYHPFDYIYNYSVRHFLKKPKIPRRRRQGKFACGIASVWIAGIAYLFYLGLDLWAYISGGMLLAVATLVTTTDICIPSIIYNFLFERKKKK